jgi:hypothetical protein
MGFFDNLREALGGDKGDDGADTAAPGPSGARHADRDATDESTAAPHVVGGKHAQRD